MASFGFLRHAAIYALGDLLLMAGGMILVPLYSRWIPQAEIGTLELLERSGEVAAICLLGRGLPLAAIAFCKQSGDEVKRRAAVAAAFLFGTASLAAGLGLLALLGGLLARFLATADEALVWAAISTALLDCIVTVALASSQARLESSYYVLVSLAQFLVRVTLCSAFVVGLAWGIWGVLAASLIRSGLFAAGMLLREWRRGLNWPEWSMFRSMFAFVFPFLPTGLCFFVLNSGDRFFLQHYGGPVAVGLYGIGYKVALLVGFFSVTPLYRVWSSRMYEAAAAADGPLLFGQVVARILTIYLFVGLGVCLFAERTLVAFAGAAFAPAASVVAPVVLACWFQSASVLFESAFYVRRQTRWKPWIAAASTVVMMALYATLIPAYGAVGAALATLAGFIVHAGLTLAAAQRVYRIRLPYGRLTGMVALAVGFWLVAAVADPGTIGKSILWLSWPVVLMFAGLIPEEELHLAREMAGAAGAQLRRLLRRRAAAPDTGLPAADRLAGS
jgi:O-antigen/teichoic acid export membrane protein